MKCTSIYKVELGPSQACVSSTAVSPRQHRVEDEELRQRSCGSQSREYLLPGPDLHLKL